MAHDLINGDVPTNWARGTSALLPYTPHTPTSTSMGRDPRKRLHHLRKIVRRAARGDTNAVGQMQRVRQNLSQRAATGDARAAALLRKIATWYVADVAQYRRSAPAEASPSWFRPQVAPLPLISPSTTDTYYPATSFPSEPPGSSDEYDDEAGRHFNDEEFSAALDGGSCEREALTRMRGPLMGFALFYPDIKTRKRRMMLRPGDLFSTTNVYPHYPSTLMSTPGKVRRNYQFIRRNPGRLGSGIQVRLLT